MHTHSDQGHGWINLIQSAFVVVQYGAVCCYVKVTDQWLKCIGFQVGRQAERPNVAALPAYLLCLHSERACRCVWPHNAMELPCCTAGHEAGLCPRCWQHCRRLGEPPLPDPLPSSCHLVPVPAFSWKPKSSSMSAAPACIKCSSFGCHGAHCSLPVRASSCNIWCEPTSLC